MRKTQEIFYHDDIRKRKGNRDHQGVYLTLNAISYHTQFEYNCVKTSTTIRTRYNQITKQSSNQIIKPSISQTTT